MSTYAENDVRPHPDLTPEWFTAMLKAADVLPQGRVVGVSSESFGTGQLAESRRFTLEYDAPDAGPATVIGKFPSADEGSRAFGAGRGLYEAEVRFYRELRDELPCAVPSAYHAAIEPDGQFVLVLEDVAPARVVDQLEGAEADDIAVAVEQLAVLHAATWGRSELAAQSWLRSIVNGYLDVLQQAWPLLGLFEDKFGDLVPEEDVAQLRLLAGAGEAWTRELTKTRCLWHQDYRLDNLLFDARGGELPVAVVDWQTVGMANGVIDLPYLIGSGLEPERRRGHEADLVRLYHDRLTSGGVEGYAWEECWTDYRVLAAHGLAGLLVGSVSVERTPRGDEMWRVWAERHAAQTRDLETFETLSRL